MIRAAFYFLLLLLWLHLPHAARAQMQQGATFYECLSNYYQEFPYQRPANGTKRSAFEKDYDRAFRMWGPKLYPHGDFSQAARAMHQYSEGYSALTAAANTVPAKWTAKGPTGTPAGPNSGKGIGQMHRITFHPGYNRGSNKTIYACSMFGGLWRTLDGGDNWTVLNTDLQLPIASVSDIAVDFANPSNIFISTGHGDGGVTYFYSPNWSSINPVHTSGMFRSTDAGATWHPINKGFMPHFRNGGTTRRIIINPSNSNQVFVATSEGIFSTANALAESPEWKQHRSGISTRDNQYRGLEFKPGNPKVVYASGQDIYRSENGGANWKSMTGKGTGLEFDKLKNGFISWRINLAVTPADPERLYAYLIGQEPDDKKKVACYIYLWDKGQWHQKHYATAMPNQVNSNHPGMMGFAVSPVDASKVYYGHTVVKGTENIDLPAPAWYGASPYSGNGMHADIRGLTFEPVKPGDLQNPWLFAATDGGISARDMSVRGQSGWQYKNDGLQVATIWTFDLARHYRDIYITGNQDVGVNVTRNVNGVWEWYSFEGGDGYGARMLDEVQKVMFYYSNGSLGRYYHQTSERKPENYATTFPTDPTENNRAMLPRTLPAADHPQSGNKIFGLTELYERTATEPSTNPDQPAAHWKVQSDIGKTKSLNGMYAAQWRRQITELEIARSDPNYVYLATGANDFSITAPDQVTEETFRPLLARSITGLSEGDFQGQNKFTDITGNLPRASAEVLVPVITGIAVHPENPRRLWVTFAGNYAGYKVYTSADAGDTWHDAASTSLPNFSINGIICQGGPTDRLYLATDAGVYTKDNTMPGWQKFGDIPNVRVMEMKVNPCTGTLSAATFGRGLWETNLLNYEGTTEFQEVTASATWHEPKHLHKNLRIKPGATLTLASDVFMPSLGRIVVEPGAKLILDGGLITNQCGASWKGIETPESSGGLLKGTVELRNGGKLENVLR